MYPFPEFQNRRGDVCYTTTYHGVSVSKFKFHGNGTKISHFGSWREESAAKLKALRYKRKGKTVSKNENKSQADGKRSSSDLWCFNHHC